MGGKGVRGVLAKPREGSWKLVPETFGRSLWGPPVFEGAQFFGWYLKDDHTGSQAHFN